MKNPEFVNPPFNPDLMKNPDFVTRKQEVQVMVMKKLGFDLEKAEDPIAMMEKWDREGYAGLYNYFAYTPEGTAALMREGRNSEKIADMFEKLILNNESLRKDYETTSTPKERYDQYMKAKSEEEKKPPQEQAA